MEVGRSRIWSGKVVAAVAVLPLSFSAHCRSSSVQVGRMEEVECRIWGLGDGHLLVAAWRLSLEREVGWQWCGRDWVREMRKGGEWGVS